VCRIISDHLSRVMTGLPVGPYTILGGSTTCSSTFSRKDCLACFLFLRRLCARDNAVVEAFRLATIIMTGRYILVGALTAKDCGGSRTGVTKDTDVSVSDRVCEDATKDRGRDEEGSLIIGRTHRVVAIMECMLNRTPATYRTPTNY
jgi:hypothetical protein